MTAPAARKRVVNFMREAWALFNWMGANMPGGTEAVARRADRCQCCGGPR